MWWNKMLPFVWPSCFLMFLMSKLCRSCQMTFEFSHLYFSQNWGAHLTLTTRFWAAWTWRVFPNWTNGPMVPGFGQSKMKSGASRGFEGLNRQNPGNFHGFGWGKVAATSHEGCSSPDFSRKRIYQTGIFIAFLGLMFGQWFWSHYFDDNFGSRWFS